MKSMPIGISDFRNIIKNNYYYVDKTLLLKDIIDENISILLLPRPRRFGKPLNMSMIRYYFEDNKENINLFKDLNIYKLGEKYKQEQCKYPVIYLTLKDIKNNTWDMTYEK